MGRYDADHDVNTFTRDGVMYVMDFSPTTVEEEKRAGGWLRTTLPIGADPMDVPEILTAGTDGSSDDAT